MSWNAAIEAARRRNCSLTFEEKRDSYVYMLTLSSGQRFGRGYPSALWSREKAIDESITSAMATIQEIEETDKLWGKPVSFEVAA